MHRSITFPLLNYVCSCLLGANPPYLCEATTVTHPYLLLHLHSTPLRNLRYTVNEQKQLKHKENVT
jgi:hypothetical protein